MSYSDEEIQLHIAQESSRFWQWDRLEEFYRGMRIIDSISHRGTGKIRGDKRDNNLGMTKEKWKEIGRRRRGRS